LFLNNIYKVKERIGKKERKNPQTTTNNGMYNSIIKNVPVAKLENIFINTRRSQ